MLAKLVPDAEAFAQAVAAHDEVVNAHGLEIWLGNEPTFTLAESTAPEWLTGAVGAEKAERARQIVIELARQRQEAILLRSIGRKYPGESEPRFSFGVFGRRDGASIYEGPPDPWLTEARGACDLLRFRVELEAELIRADLPCRGFPGASDQRAVFVSGARTALPEAGDEERLQRPSLHQTRSEGPLGMDELATEGLFLLQLRAGDGWAELELPAFSELSLFLKVLACAGRAARRASVPALVLCGYPPPVTAECRFLTVTPDPAVVEINMPPFSSVSEFMAENRRTYAAAKEAGLTPYRLRHNGVVADSGGGGQITFGGPSPLASPFLKVPQLLPRLLRYVLWHPSFSYLFAHDYVGASGQSVRPDELGADTLAELKLSLSLLERVPQIDAATLWRSLAPCLTDLTGNAHRAELNVEKLWNPADYSRGQLGLVEMRALRMQDTPERAAALGALMRAVIAMLMLRDHRLDFPDHGPLLHDRFALPFFLERDLEDVLEDLEAGGFGLGAPLIAELRRDGFRHLATLELDGIELTLRRAVEFWPLVGDATLQQGTSRLVDASTARLELLIRPRDAEGERLLEGVELRAMGQSVPLRAERDRHGPARVFGLRYRSFRPLQGLHPTLSEQSPLELCLAHPLLPRALAVSFYDWKPGGGAYEQLPADVEEAHRRCQERCVTRFVPRDSLPELRSTLPAALTGYALDLRYPTRE